MQRGPEIQIRKYRFSTKRLIPIWILGLSIGIDDVSCEKEQIKTEKKE